MTSFEVLGNVPRVDDVRSIAQLECGNSDIFRNAFGKVVANLNESKTLTFVSDIEKFEVKKSLDRVRRERSGSTGLVGEIEED